MVQVFNVDYVMHELWMQHYQPLVLWHCWLGNIKRVHPTCKNFQSVITDLYTMISRKQIESSYTAREILPLSATGKAGKWALNGCMCAVTTVWTNWLYSRCLKMSRYVIFVEEISCSLSASLTHISMAWARLPAGVPMHEKLLHRVTSAKVSYQWRHISCWG